MMVNASGRSNYNTLIWPANEETNLGIYGLSASCEKTTCETREQA